MKIRVLNPEGPVIDNIYNAQSGRVLYRCCVGVITLAPLHSDGNASEVR